MVNLRQSISTIKKKSKDAIPASPATKFRKSVMGGSPTGGSSHKRMSMFNLRSKNSDPDDLSSHIGEIKLTESTERFTSLHGFKVEEEVTEEDDLARKTDLKLQERREIRRKRQEELQKQLQQKLHSSPDSTNPSNDQDFPTALPLDMDIPQITRGRKSTMIRNKRAGNVDRPIRATVGQNQPGDTSAQKGRTGDLDRPSRATVGKIQPGDASAQKGRTGDLDRPIRVTVGQSQSADPSAQRGRSPGKRMTRKSRMFDGSDQQRTSVRALHVHKETAFEHETIPETDEKDRIPGRSSREQVRKGRKRDEGANGETNGEPHASSPAFGDRTLTEKQASQRRERRKTDFVMGQKKPTRSKERGEDLSSGAQSNSQRSPSGTARKMAELRARQRQSVRPVRDMPESLGHNLDSSHESTGLNESIRSSDRIGDRNTSVGLKSKFSRDEDDDQRGTNVHSEHRITTSGRRKRREKMDVQENGPLPQSEPGKGRAVKRTEKSPRTKRKTLAAGALNGKQDVQSDSPQSETRKLRSDLRKQKRRESETLRTNRSLDDGLGIDGLLSSEHQAKEKSNGVRFRGDVKDTVSSQNIGERRKSPKTEGRKKVQVEGEKMRRSPKSPRVSKKISPRGSQKRLSLKDATSKTEQGKNSKMSNIKSPPIWDDEYGEQVAPSKKKQAPSWALENADVYEPTKFDSKPSTMSRSGALESIEDASESQHDFEYEEEDRNRRPDFESGEKWLEPIVSDDEVKIEPALNENIDKPDTSGEGSKPAEIDGVNARAEQNPDTNVEENSSASSGEYSSSASEEAGVIPDEVPVVNADYDKRVSSLQLYGVSSSDESEGDSSDSSSSSSGESSTSAGEVPAIVSIQDSIEQLMDDEDISSNSVNSSRRYIDEEDEEGDEEEQEKQILPSSFRSTHHLSPFVDVGRKNVEMGNSDIPPPPEDIPPPPPPPPEESLVVTARDRARKASLSGDETNDDDAFDSLFSNEIRALEGTLQGMGDLVISPSTTQMKRNQSAPAPPAPPAMQMKRNQSAPASSSFGHKHLIDILGMIAPLSSEQKEMLESNPEAREEVMFAVAEKEQRNRLQIMQKVQILEKKLSMLQKDLEIQQLESASHKMQVEAQDMVILDYKDAVEILTQKSQSLEKEADVMALKYREQEEKTYRMMESLEETKKLVKEQQMFMNAQQRQMQTMESKISSFEESRNREESKMIVQNEKLHEIIRIQKDTIMKTLAKHREQANK